MVFLNYIEEDGNRLIEEEKGGKEVRVDINLIYIGVEGFKLVRLVLRNS